MQSKYYQTWDEYIAQHPEIPAEYADAVQPGMQTYEEQMFRFIMSLFG